MSYHIRPSERFTKEFKAVGSEQLQLAITALTEHPDGLLTAIHDARKCFKRLRSLYRLVAADAPAFQHAENARIRDMAKTLSMFRDATALAEVGQYLRQYAGTAEQRAALKRIGKILAARRDEAGADDKQLEECVAKTVAACGRALEALTYVTFDDGAGRSAKRLAKGWRKILKRATAAKDACKDTTDAHLFHELRKRCQDYRYFLDLLQPLWPSAMHAKRTRTTDLVDLLGHHNDLALLSALVNEQPALFGPSEDLAHLLAALIARQAALRAEILKAGESVLQEEATDESRKIRLLWQDAA